MSQEAAAGVGPGEQCPQHQEAERERQAVGLGAYGGRRGGARGLGLAAASVHEIFQATVLEWGAIAFSDPRGKPACEGLLGDA